MTIDHHFPGNVIDISARIRGIASDIDGIVSRSGSGIHGGQSSAIGALNVEGVSTGSQIDVEILQSVILDALSQTQT